MRAEADPADRSPHDGATVRTFRPPADDTTPAAIAAGKAGRTISVCVPCRNEAATIGPMVEAIRAELGGVVDELLVVDDRSTDASADIARTAGARVVSTAAVEARHGPGEGKGNVLWTSLLASHGDLVVWCDADVTSFEPGWICRLVHPLLVDADVALVKACASRPTDRGGGGRTTELVARPLLSRYFPALAGLVQPLAGEYAGRRDVLEAIPFAQGWGVEVAMLIDIARMRGAAAIGQVDLGRRVHRHRDLHALSVQAAEVMSTVLDRAGVGDGEDQTLIRSDGSTQHLNLRQRPPVATLDRAVGLAS